MLHAAIAAAALLAAAPALAAPRFQAQPDVTPPATRFVLRDTLWTCGETGCAAAEGNSRPAIVCAVLAREVGTLRSFSFEGRSLSSDALDTCNSRARKLPSDRIRTAAHP